MPAQLSLSGTLLNCARHWLRDVLVATPPPHFHPLLHKQDGMRSRWPTPAKWEDKAFHFNGDLLVHLLLPGGRSWMRMRIRIHWLPHRDKRMQMQTQIKTQTTGVAKGLHSGIRSAESEVRTRLTRPHSYFNYFLCDFRFCHPVSPANPYLCFYFHFHSDCHSTLVARFWVSRFGLWDYTAHRNGEGDWGWEWGWWNVNEY